MHGGTPEGRLSGKAWRAALLAGLVLWLGGGAGRAVAAAPLSTDVALQRVESVSAIKRLQRAYGWYFDQGRWDEAAALFTSGGSIEYAMDGVYRGQARVRQYLTALGGGHLGLVNGQMHEQFMLQPVIHLAADGQSATGRWHTWSMIGSGTQAMWGDGVYQARYVREGGTWKIASLHWVQGYVVPYEGGWAAHADDSGGRHVTGLTPDRPPTVAYTQWPQLQRPPLQPGPEAIGQVPQVAGADALATRVARLQDLAAIEQLVGAYGEYLDGHHWAPLLQLFAPQAEVEIGQRGVYVGRDSIARLLRLLGPSGRATGVLHTHIQEEPVIHVSADGRQAWVRNRDMARSGRFGGEGWWSDAVNEIQLTRQGGHWRVARLQVFPTFRAPYEGGWAVGGSPLPTPDAASPPDRPPTLRYGAYPEVFVPPYHYVGNASWPVIGVPAASGDAGLLAARVARLEDEAAVTNLQRIYGLNVDKARWQETAQLFADDATLEIGGRGVFVGRPRVLQYLQWLDPLGLRPGKLYNHIQLQPVVTVAPDGQSARARWRFLAQVGEAGKSGIWGMGIYENDYVRQQGQWRIRTLHAYFRMYTPYAAGWGRSPTPNTRPEKDLPPDLPPRVVHDTWPGTFLPPVHFANPVTGLTRPGTDDAR